MSKVIIVKNKEDNGFKIIIPNDKLYGEEEGKIPLSEEKALTEFRRNGHEWFLIDRDNFPEKGESRKQWYYNGQEVLLDLSWSVRLMPDQLIKKKHINRISKKIDDELAKEAPDAIALIKFQREHDKCKTIRALNQNDDPFWLEQALKNLDEDGHDKPEIKEKLRGKIEELKNPNRGR